jgi:hypothetical protein
MKLQSNISHRILDSLTRDEIKNLTIETKETLAPAFLKERKRIFTAADLWNIQAKKKRAAYRRAYL